ncbi:hypothetical protein [Alteromonas sp. a30]|uniref:hypothetical protein n=1 Tax=Alteromonas sp. a30 TaxID=2730917 RepID=UPI00228189A3|nr:hypothetical protein [Alteromonas sp. a30]MCY7297176.1 hypothetical protein [Alteromonas sp. a30]
MIPVIGHEVAHRILRNIGSRNLIPQLLALKGRFGTLGNFLRKVSGVYRPIMMNIGISEFQKMEVELMCDLLSATRFGYSYLYCWFINGFHTDAYTLPLMDEFGRLDENLITANINKPIYDSEFEVLQRYILGKSLIYWLKSMGSSDVQNEIVEAITDHLDLLLISTYEKDIIGTALYIVKEIKKEIKIWNKREPLMKLRSGFDRINYSSDYWMYTQNTSEWLRNAINENLISLLNNKLSPQKSPDTTNQRLDDIPQSVSDFSWIINWKISHLNCLQEKDNEEEHNQDLLQISSFQAVYSRLLIEDYVFNSRNILASLHFTILKFFNSNPGESYKSFFENINGIWISNQLNIKNLKEELTNNCLDKFSLTELNKIEPLNPSFTKNPFSLRATNLKINEPLSILKSLKYFISIISKIKVESITTKPEKVKLREFTPKELDLLCNIEEVLSQNIDYFLKISTCRSKEECLSEFLSKHNSTDHNLLLYRIELSQIKLTSNFKLDERKDRTADYYFECLLGTYDFLDIYRHNKQQDIKNNHDALLNTSSRDALIVFNTLEENSPVHILVKISLFKEDFRLNFIRYFKEALKKIDNIRAALFLSFGPEDAFLAISFTSNLVENDSFDTVIDFLNNLYDDPVVSRTERIYTNSFLDILSNHQEISKNFGMKIKIKLTPRPQNTLKTTLERLRHIFKCTDIFLSNGEIDITIPITNQIAKLSEFQRKLIVEDNGLLNNIQRFSTELHYKYNGS